MPGIPFIGENGFYPRWARRGDWVFQRTLVSVSSMHGLAELAAADVSGSQQAIVWVPQRGILSRLIRANIHNERFQALNLLCHMRLSCYARGCVLSWTRFGGPYAIARSCVTEDGIYPENWRLSCALCGGVVGPYLSHVHPDPIIRRWEASGKPRLENPCASLLFRSVERIGDLPGWIRENEPSNLELAYLGQQMWPNIGSMLKIFESPDLNNSLKDRDGFGATSESNQIRINELARELGVKGRAIIDFLPHAGVSEKKMYSSSIDVPTADQVRAHFRDAAETEATAGAKVLAEKIGLEDVTGAVQMMAAAAVEEDVVAEKVSTPIDPIELESAVLKLLSRVNRPLRARAIAALLSTERPTSLHKREINPTLYRMLSRGRLCRDSQFRWYLNEKSHPLAPNSSENVASQPEGSFRSSNPSQNVAQVTESSPFPEQSQNEATEDSSNREPSGVADEGNAFQAPLPHTRNYGRFQVVEVIRPYIRHCTWCSLEIPEGKVALVAHGLGKHSPRFCTEDCFQNWESIYWQRIALSHLGLSKEERNLEERCLRRQKYFARSNNF